MMHGCTRRAAGALVIQPYRYRSLQTLRRWNGIVRYQSSSTSSKLPVAIFIDLDNVAPTTQSREDAKALADPLRSFAEAAGELKVFRAFANKSTLTFKSQEEKIRQEQVQEEYIKWDGMTVQSGFDKNGILRCGVCGYKAVLTKKDRAIGLDEHMRLEKHFAMLHDREQEKRQTRIINMKKKEKKSGKVPKYAKLNEKESEKYNKYEAAKFGLGFSQKSRAKKKKESQPRNELRRILKEQGMRVNTADSVDDALIKAAQSWINGVGTKGSSLDGSDVRGCLVVVSKDGDFSDLLRKKNFVTVAVTPDSTTQTKKLVDASDIVLSLDDIEEEIDDEVEGVYGVFGPLIAKPITSKGTRLLEQMEKRNGTGDHDEDESDGAF